MEILPQFAIYLLNDEDFTGRSSTTDMYQSIRLPIDNITAATRKVNPTDSQHWLT